MWLMMLWERNWKIERTEGVNKKMEEKVRFIKNWFHKMWLVLYLCKGIQTRTAYGQRSKLKHGNPLLMLFMQKVLSSFARFGMLEGFQIQVRYFLHYLDFHYWQSNGDYWNWRLSLLIIVKGNLHYDFLVTYVYAGDVHAQCLPIFHTNLIRLSAKRASTNIFYRQATHTGNSR